MTALLGTEKFWASHQWYDVQWETWVKI